MDIRWIIAISFLIIFLGTAIGSAFVFLFKKRPGDKLLAISLGLAAGVMIAASFFGLLNPSIEEAKANYGKELAWIPPLLGLLLGTGLLYLIDKIVPHIHINTGHQEGVQAPNFTNQFKFFLAVTIHNLPEGLVTGFAGGLALSSFQNGNTEQAAAYAMSALILSIGIAVQDIPEGMAVSVPLYIEGMGRGKAFGFGVASGAVQPIAAVAGLFLASALSSAMSYFLSFGAGAMLYVVIDDLVPQFSKKGVEHYGIWAFVIGLGFMMLMETLL